MTWTSQANTHQRPPIGHNFFLNVVHDDTSWFGLFSTRTTVEWTCGLKSIHLPAHVFDWSIINCMLKSLDFYLLSVWLQSPCLEEGREEEAM